MTKRMVAFLVLGLSTSPVAAQESPSGGDDFCATAPNELLAALDGSWSLTQGPGVEVSGAPLPLPGHPPVEMRLEYNAEGGYAILSGQGQQMVMLPMLTETASDLLGGWFEHFVTSSEDLAACDWYALPTLVGTNQYDLIGTTTPSPSIAIDATEGLVAAIHFCMQGDSYFLIGGEAGYGPGYDTEYEKDAYQCKGEISSNQGDMSMTIALKFDSPSSASGTLVFSGSQGKYSFAAWAPITMSR